jgi:O-acetyl-ADP-ribose deacetylase (regulator of RNase III)
VPRRTDIKSLYYITHVENVASMLQRGILAHGLIEAKGIAYTPIYDNSIVNNRKDKATPDQRSLWDYANLYFQPRNPMMYRVVHEKAKNELAVVGVKPSVLDLSSVVISDGNAASSPTQFFRGRDGIKMIQSQWKLIQAEWWNDRDGSKRRIMAECLVPERVPPEFIHTVFVADYDAKKRLEELAGATKVPIVPEPHMFFQPFRRDRIGTNITLVDGDMFFSGMHTLTVSVNLQGIMGRGLASRAKYQFPDVYVFYQDACRSKRLGARKPCLYKREASVDEELADLTTPLKTHNAVKWFLLFATKRKWRENSRIDDIEAGLAWFCDHFEVEGVQSAAFPALGCGLGNLDWAQVGPVMCKYLHGIGIDVAIYLPREKAMDQRLRSEEYLLQGV